MPGNMISFWRSYMEESIDISSAPRMCARILLTQEIRTKKFSELVEISAPWWMIPARTMLWFTSNTVSWDTADSQADCKERVYIRQVVGKMHRVRDMFQLSNAFTSDSMQCKLKSFAKRMVTSQADSGYIPFHFSLHAEAIYFPEHWRSEGAISMRQMQRTSWFLFNC
jgi:hypothetical protein